MDTLLFHLLTHPIDPEPVLDLDMWWPRYERAAEGFAAPIERAIAGGFAADRLGYAFAAGYHEALRRLVPTLGKTRAALCATEAGGAHPRAIAARLFASEDGLQLDGDKTWVTLGTHAAALLVVASEGTDSQGRNRLCVCQVPATRLGVTLSAQPPTPFAPEIPHAALRLHKVQILPSERLPGDGYTQYLKPFRTIEDLHVHAALLGWLVQIARRASWPRPLVEELVVLLATVRALAGGSPDDPTLHLALAGLLAACRRLLQQAEAHWQNVEPSLRDLWLRDRLLLEVAGKARSLRLAAAWEQLQLGAKSSPARADIG